MGLLISKPIGKLSRVFIRALLVIYQKEVIEKKLFNTLTKLAWGHRSQEASPQPYGPCPAPLLRLPLSLVPLLSPAAPA